MFVEIETSALPAGFQLQQQKHSQLSFLTIQEVEKK